MKFSSFFPVWIAAIILGFGILVEPGEAAPQRPLGIDVSSYQGNKVVWSNVLSSGVTWAWAKAAEGTATDGYVGQDPDFTVNATNAKAAGVVIGYYYYCHPEVDMGLAGADAEAAFFWNVVKPYMKADGLTLMPMLDFEQDLSSASPAYTAATLSAWGNEWCQDIVNYGLSNGLRINPVFYTYISYADGGSGNGPGFDTSVTQWPLDMANYPYTDPQTGAPQATYPWSDWTFWQYNTSQIVPGVPNGDCDEDVFHGTAAGLSNYVVSLSGPTITAQPTNVSVIQGGAASFSVAAITSPLAYQWEFDSTSIAGATNTTLSLTNLEQSDAGNYAVVVTNGVGSVTSTNALLTVMPMVSNVAVMPRLSSAIITWNSATNANGQVQYGLDTNYSLALPVAPALTLQHSALLAGLQFGTTYYFEVISSNSPYAGTNTGSFSTDVSLIVESSQAYYSGIWTVDSAAPDKYDLYYEYAATSTGSDTADAVFRPNVATPGFYDVYLWYSQGTNRSQAAPVTVGYQGGAAELLENEQTNGGSWQLLVAGMPFAAGTNGFVRLGNGTGESRRVVIADAVKFVYSADQDLPTNSTPPAWWLSYYFGTNAVNASSDPDGDGYSTLAEYLAGTVPTDGTSHLSVTGQAAPGGGVQVIFSPYYFNAGRQYQLQSSASLIGAVWTNLPLSTVTTNTNGAGVLTITNLTGSQNYLRLSVSMTQQ